LQTYLFPGLLAVKTNRAGWRTDKKRLDALMEGELEDRERR
jgi:hypothetical protein